MLPENAELCELFRQSRIKWAHEALKLVVDELVVDEAARYGAELERRDPLNRGRMSRQRDALLTAVRRCYEASDCCARYPNAQLQLSQRDVSGTLPPRFLPAEKTAIRK